MYRPVCLGNDQHDTSSTTGGHVSGVCLDAQTARQPGWAARRIAGCFCLSRLVSLLFQLPPKEPLLRARCTQCRSTPSQQDYLCKPQKGAMMNPMMGMVSIMKDRLTCRPQRLPCWLQQPEWITFAALAATSNYPAQRGHRHQPGHTPACEQHQCVHGTGRHGAHHPGAQGHGQAHPRRQGGCGNGRLLLAWYCRCSHTAQHSTLPTRVCAAQQSVCQQWGVR